MTYLFRRYEELSLLVLAGLVSYGAAGLACRLAGSLALAASAVFSTAAEVSGAESLDMLSFHVIILLRFTAKSL